MSLDWYTDNFCIGVHNFCTENDLPPKVILLLDIAPGHALNLDEVHRKLKVNIVYMSPNTMSVLLLMDQ